MYSMQLLSVCLLFNLETRRDDFLGNRIHEDKQTMTGLLAVKYGSDTSESEIDTRIMICRSWPYNLRSNSDNLLLEIEKVNTYTTLGDRAFQVAAPKLWNNLAFKIRSSLRGETLNYKVVAMDDF